MNRKKSLIFACFFLLSLFVFPLLARAKEQPWKQSVEVGISGPSLGFIGGSVGGGVADSWGYGTIPPLSISVNHNLKSDDTGTIYNKEDSIDFVYSADSINVLSISSGNSGPGAWCANLDEQCFTPDTSTGVLNPANGGSFSGYYHFFTGVKPKVRMFSDNPAVVECPDFSGPDPSSGLYPTISCQAVNSGTATLSLQIEPIPLISWFWSGSHFCPGSFFGSCVSNSSSLFGFFLKNINETEWSSSAAPYSVFNTYYFDLNRGLPDFLPDQRGVTLKSNKLTPLDIYLNDFDSVINTASNGSGNSTFWPISFFTGAPEALSYLTTSITSNKFNKPSYFTEGDFSWLSLRLPFSEFREMEKTMTPGETLRHAISRHYSAPPFNGFVPVVEYFTPGNRTDTIFMPGYPLATPDIPPIIIKVDPDDDTNQSPSISVDNILPVEPHIRPTIKITVTDQDTEDKVKYCVDWNEDGDVTDATASELGPDLNDPEGCVPSTGYRGQENNGGTISAIFSASQAWNTPGTKKFKVYAEDNTGNKCNPVTLTCQGPRSGWKEASVEIKTNTPTPICGDGFKNRPGEQCDGTDFGGATCQSLGFQKGFLTCNSSGPTDSCSINTSLCSTCGNSKVEGIEECDKGAANSNSGASVCNTSCKTRTPDTPPTQSCNNNNKCEPSRRENFLNCWSDCNPFIKEVQAPKPSFMAWVLGTLGLR